MRVLLIAPPWFAVPPIGYGGIEWVVASLSDGLVDAGHDVTLVASGGSVTKAELQAVYPEPPTSHLGDPWYEAVHCLTAYENACDYDIIHDHTGSIGTSIAARMSRRPPVVHTLHGPWTEANRPFYRLLCDDLALVAISHDQASRAPSSVRISGVVHNGVELARYPYQERKGDFLLFVGRASPEKGPELAVEVAKRAGLPLVMAIKVNEAAEIEYFDRAVAPMLADADVDVRVGVGHEEKVELMGSAKAVIVPIRWDEPFGLVMTEAMACGTPIVAYARGAAPEIVVPGSTGYLVESGDIEGLAAAVEDVDRIDPLACRRRVEESFSSERMVEGYANLYERLLTGPMHLEPTGTGDA